MKKIRRCIIVSALIALGIFTFVKVKSTINLLEETSNYKDVYYKAQIDDLNNTNRILAEEKDAAEMEYESAQKRCKELENEVETLKADLEEEENIRAAEERAKAFTSVPVSYSGQVLTPAAGRINGPSGQETYYNLPMEGVIRNMRDLGFDEVNYPYAVRSDGVKTLGGYVMVAANLAIRPKGTIIATSLGAGIVCDTGGFALVNPTQLDIAVAW